jgi:hypothetical protein
MQLAVIAPFPVIVWGVDELVRWARRRHDRAGTDADSAVTTVVRPAITARSALPSGQSAAQA